VGRKEEEKKKMKFQTICTLHPPPTTNHQPLG